jgi:DNA-directed RNA polymerase beta subunit
MPTHRYFLTDFVTIQRQSFFELLEKGLIEEFSKRNPITNTKKDLEFLFYPEYYILTRPEYTPQEAIIKNKSYTSKLFVPGQLTDFKSKKKILKWFYIGNIPLMTKRGHFILNGAARVIVNQILRSPGIYYQQKIYENYQEKWSQKPDDTYKRFYADLICMRGTWLRIEMDKEKNIWAQMKKGPKIPMYWFLLAMGLSEKKIFKSITDSFKLLGNLKNARSSSSSLLLSSPEENPYLSTQGGKPNYPEGKIPSSGFSSEEIENPQEGGFAIGEKEKVTTSKKRSLSKEKESKQNKKYAYLKSPPEAWVEIYKLLSLNTIKKNKDIALASTSASASASGSSSAATQVSSHLVAASSISKGGQGVLQAEGKEQSQKEQSQKEITEKKKAASIQASLAEEGRKWLYNKFMNPRSYNLGKQGRLAFNKKLSLNISTNQTTLTGLDVLYATDYLIKVEKGIFKIDDIDHLKNRRVRTSGELIQIQVGVGLVRLEKSIRENLNKFNLNFAFDSSSAGSPSMAEHRGSNSPLGGKKGGNVGNSTMKSLPKGTSPTFPTFAYQREVGVGQAQKLKLNSLSKTKTKKITSSPLYSPLCYTSSIAKAIDKYSFQQSFSNFIPKGEREQRELPSGKGLVEAVRNSQILINFVNSKAFNSAIREFFGTSPLSQFMDQINPLAELTHKRRLSSMGPGGVTRDTATLAIRGIHPTHYGRICPIETPEGKNTGLVNSMTTYARVNSNGIIESPFYKVYKGQVQKKTGMYFFSAEQEEKIRLAAADLSTSSIGFLPKSFIPVRIAEDFTKIPRSQVQYVGVSPLQMISIATSLIPFLEHDDANRALMGSNMQRQAVPLIKPERPIVGTGLEARTISDSGHAIIAKSSGFVTYVSSKKIVVCSM